MYSLRWLPGWPPCRFATARFHHVSRLHRLRLSLRSLVWIVMFRGISDPSRIWTTFRRFLNDYSYVASSIMFSSPNFNSCQSAYRKGHSTETALTRLLNDIYCAADRRSRSLLIPPGLVRGIRYSRHRHTHSPPAVDVWHQRFGARLDPVVPHRQIPIRACRGEQIWQGRVRIRCSPGFSAWPYPLRSLCCTSRKCYHITWCLSSTIRRWHSTVHRAEKRRLHC